RRQGGGDVRVCEDRTVRGRRVGARDFPRGGGREGERTHGAQRCERQSHRREQRIQRKKRGASPEGCAPRRLVRVVQLAQVSARNVRVVQLVHHASAAMVTFSFAVTSECSLTCTSWVPTSLSGSGRWICLRSTW